MRDFADLGTSELLALGRRAFELAACRLDQISGATGPEDRPLRALIQKMALESEHRAAEVEQHETLEPEDSFPGATPDDTLTLIHGYLTSLNKRFGEGPLTRDAALFFAESLEEEIGRLCRVLAQHANEWPVNRLFMDLADREQGDVRYLREVVLES